MTTDDDNGLLETFDELKQAIDHFWSELVRAIDYFWCELRRPFEAIVRRLGSIIRRFQ